MAFYISLLYVSLLLGVDHFVIDQLLSCWFIPFLKRYLLHSIFLCKFKFCFDTFSICLSHLVQKYMKKVCLSFWRLTGMFKFKFSVSQLFLFCFRRADVNATFVHSRVSPPSPRQPRHQKRFYVLPYPYLAHSVATSPALGKYFRD